MVHGYALVEGTVLTWEGYLPPELRVFTVPFKLNQDRRHHPPRQKHKVANSPAYEAGLRQRGSVTVWLTERSPHGKQRQGRCEVVSPYIRRWRF
jgi:hypothetical protein